MLLPKGRPAGALQGRDLKLLPKGRSYGAISIDAFQWDITVEQKRRTLAHSPFNMIGS